MDKNLSIFWFRRDLRLHDNHGFYKALSNSESVLPIFIFDSNILESLPENDARVNFIHQELHKMNSALADKGYGSIGMYHGKPIEVFQSLIDKYEVSAVYTNKDYEPYATSRDQNIEALLSQHNIGFHTFKDHVIFEESEVVKDDGNPYVVYTPYMKKWKSQFSPELIRPFASEDLLHITAQIEVPKLSLEAIGFKKSEQRIKDYEVSPELIQDYEATRNFPAKDATSRLGPHLRFGTVSIRTMMQKAVAETNEIFWQELIWREFFQQILWHFPHTKDQAFKAKYDRIEWRNNEDEFKKWCQGKTGYPLVDAGMRQLNETGFMHNRIRMLVGSFLCKHLLIDWRWGEAYFAEKLHDYEMASNVGNWQWVAGSGVDAAPYFRIFNPTSQIQKFDKQLEYIKRWVPDFQELSYPKPIVDHKMARERCLETYKSALN
jgi:deoxyribodipyrimidine photo-lyase